jgi:hypothetical protein
MSILDDGYHFPAPTIGTAARPDGVTLDDEQMITLDGQGAVCGVGGVQICGVAMRPAPSGPASYGEGVATFRSDGTISAALLPGSVLYRVDPHTLSTSSDGATRLPAARFWAYDDTADRPVQALVGRVVGAQLAGR